MAADLKSEQEAYKNALDEVRAYGKQPLGMRDRGVTAAMAAERKARTHPGDVRDPAYHEQKAALHRETARLAKHEAAALMHVGGFDNTRRAATIRSMMEGHLNDAGYHAGLAKQLRETTGSKASKLKAFADERRAEHAVVGPILKGKKGGMYRVSAGGHKSYIGKK